MLDHVDGTVELLAAGLALALELQNDLDSLKGSSDGCSGDGGEETCGRDLGDGEALLGVHLGHRRHNLLTDIVTPERDGEHGGDSDQGSHDSSVEASGTVGLHDATDHVHGALVLARRAGLQTHLDQIKRMTNQNGADTSKATGGEGLGLRQERLESGRGSDGLNARVNFGSVTHCVGCVEGIVECS